MHDDIDIMFSDEYDRWVGITAHGTITVFPDEDKAAEFQRYWRELNCLDPMTGEPLEVETA